jgi:hypothetical protein
MKAQGLSATFLAFALVTGACGGNGDAPKATRAGNATPTTEGGAVSQNPEGEAEWAT